MLTACPIPEKRKSHDIIAAFVRGAPPAARGCVFYGVKASNKREWSRAKLDRSTSHYLIDNSYFDVTRGTRYRVTKNRLQVAPAEHKTDGKRFAQLRLRIEPWRCAPDGYWLAIHQSHDHTNSAPDHVRWMAEAVASLSADRPVMHRQWSADKAELAHTLPQALQGAYGLVTHTSSAAVQASIAGLTCIVSDDHALSGLRCSADPALDQRAHFLGVLADNEFTLAELEDGTAWRQLNP